MSSSIFETVFNRGSAGNCLLLPTPEATVIAVNDALLRFASRVRKDVVGASVFDIFPGNPDDSGDTGEGALRLSIHRAIATGTAQTMAAQRYPIQIERPNGETVYEERYWSAVNTPIFDEHGKLVCISHTTLDITDKVRSENALRDSETRLRAYITATSDVLYRMSPDWTYMHELDGRGFLKTTSNWAEYKIEEYVYPDDLDLVHRTLDAAIRNKTVFELEHRVWRAEGTHGWTYSRAVPMLDADGEIYEWIGAASDISERKFAELKLRDEDRRKDEFLAMLAHELRNPLAPISAAAELLKLGRMDEPRVRHTSEIIGRQVRHMTGLVDDLLDVSRVTRGTIELERAKLDIRKVVADAVEQVNPMMQARRHNLMLQVMNEAAVVSGDQKRLVQVLANLLTNAAKYTPEGGTIRLQAEAHADRVLLAIEDNGVGMAPELVNRAFELFSQAERTSDRSAGGLGLGLAIVKSLVEQHGGTVACASKGAGQGSIFTVTLPRLAEAAECAGRNPQSHDSDAAAAALKILVVDDNVDAARMLAMFLEASGHIPLVEHTPARALELARTERPDVCLLDIGMPEMDGNELAQRLRRQPETTEAMLVAVTGYGQKLDRQKSLRAGFDHYLVKPVSTGRLLTILDAFGRNKAA